MELAEALALPAQNFPCEKGETQHKTLHLYDQLYTISKSFVTLSTTDLWLG